jgi:hypothetical protein
VNTKAQGVRTIVISLTSLAAVTTALNLLANGQALTSAQSGVNAEDPITQLSLIGEPKVIFDGFYWTVMLFVTTA